MNHRLETIIAGFLLILLILGNAASAQEMTLSGPEDVTNPDIAGQQITPVSIVYQDTPYLFWCSNSMGVTGDPDFDILYSRMSGGQWGTETVLTDSSAGYDHTPQPIVYRGDLFLFWSSDDELATGGGTDIVFARFDGETWSQTISLTSEFNQMGDYNPWPVVFNSELWIFFEWYSLASSSYEVGSIRYDGSQWSDPEAVTSSSTGHNLNPSAVVNSNSLILAWESSSDIFTGNDVDSAIVTRIFSAGSWSNYSSLSGSAGPRNQDPFAIAYGGDAWIFWSTNSQQISMGGDFDIVGRHFSSGGWDSNVVEISSGGSGNETGPSAIVFGERLAISWISASQEFSEGPDTDIVISFYDGDSWSVPLDISGEDGGLDDAGGFTYKFPCLLVYDDSLFIIWETNASPDFLTASNTWLLMSTLRDAPEKDNTIYWLALISFVCIGIAAVGLWKFGRK